MNTNNRGSGGRRAPLVAVILATVGLGLVGCQTGVADGAEPELEAAPSAAQVQRTAAASQSRYEGLAEYWAQRALYRDYSVPVVADRLAPQVSGSTSTQVPIVADRVASDTTEPTPAPTPIVADRIDG